ncbi:MAG: hypothetical protein KME45_21545 [Stenomitos rutilans HA7619-LM2]|jgi:hypothetical protein|nr:hypothetical protein [Stenomitos rutilans HA7619-LM2]
MRYNYPTKNELLANPDKVFQMKRIELQSWGTWFRNNGYEMCKLNAPSALIANAVYDAFVLMAQLRAECSPVEPVTPEKETISTPTPMNPAKRDYPITSETALTSPFMRSQLKGDLLEALDRFFSNELLLFPQVTFHFSKAR